MRHVQQRGQECLLAAICQLVPDLDYEAIRPGYDPEQYLYWAFKSTHVPPIVYEIIRAHENTVVNKFGGFDPQRAKIVTPDIRPPDLNGQGILAGYNKYHCHAVSYKDKLILDPYYEFMPETWEQFSGRWGPPMLFWWTVPISTAVPLTAGSTGVTLEQV